MQSKTRFALGVACCVGIGALVAVGRWKGTSPGSSSLAGTGLQSRDCRACHEQVWQEWESSYHSRAWSDDRVQAAFQHFGFDRKCQSCHAPEPVLLLEAGAPVPLRETDRESGVNCSSCHTSAHGVAARRTVTDAPCRPVASDLASSQSCAACHVAIHKDWEASRYKSEGKKGESCQDCHMPAVASRPGGRSHVFLGGHDDATVRAGARFECHQEESQLVVQVTNHATGHNFPGERHNRMLFLEVIQRNADGDIELARQELIKGITPFRGETSQEKIKVDESFVARFPCTPAAVEADVKLLYKPFPWYPDRQALVVHHKKLKLARGHGTASP